MRIAQETKQDLRSLCGWSGPLTHRQYLTWTEYLQGQWNEPDRHDWYQMQTAYIVARVLGGSKGDLEDFKLSFRAVSQSVPAGHSMTLEEETAYAQQAWFTRVGLIPARPRLRDGTRDGNRKPSCQADSG
jgi:hypothetical protein